MGSWSVPVEPQRIKYKEKFHVFFPRSIALAVIYNVVRVVEKIFEEKLLYDWYIQWIIYYLTTKISAIIYKIQQKILAP